MNRDTNMPSTDDVARTRRAEAVENNEYSGGDDAPTADEESLLFASDGEGYRSRWSDIQAEFVDHPRQAVEKADGLVAEIMQEVAHVFADERGRLESQWDRGDEVDTEDLRIALKRYRSFFERLLNA
ncbi:MAG TPA: hypothetical protein VE777_02965 [Gaiellales bacterium]|jgi:hypothetical protein|nr:hypothetical protein [Gaiellales bacterium]